MKNKTCPKCGSNEMLTDLVLQTGGGSPPHVEIIEPRPEKPPFLWIPESIISYFQAEICGACGYTEFYAINYKELNEGWKKGYENKSRF